MSPLVIRKHFTFLKLTTDKFWLYLAYHVINIRLSVLRGILRPAWHVAFQPLYTFLCSLPIVLTENIWHGRGRREGVGLWLLRPLGRTVSWDSSCAGRRWVLAGVSVQGRDGGGGHAGAVEGDKLATGEKTLAGFAGVRRWNQ